MFRRVHLHQGPGAGETAGFAGAQHVLGCQDWLAQSVGEQVVAQFKPENVGMAGNSPDRVVTIRLNLRKWCMPPEPDKCVVRGLAFGIGIGVHDDVRDLLWYVHAGLPRFVWLVCANGAGSPCWS